jgi:hypothetical protein
LRKGKRLLSISRLRGQNGRYSERHPNAFRTVSWDLQSAGPSESRTDPLGRKTTRPEGSEDVVEREKTPFRLGERRLKIGGHLSEMVIGISKSNSDFGKGVIEVIQNS